MVVKRYARYSLLVVVCGASAIGVGPSGPSHVQAPFSFATFPRVSGSTSTQPITILAVCRIFGWTHRWSVSIDDEAPRRVWPDIISDDFASTLWPRIQHRQTHESYVDLINGKTDLILVAREPSADERQLIDRQGVALDVRPVALDALVFVVNIKNAITKLRLEDIRELYAGRQVTWKDFGGDSDRPVVPLVGNRNSGSHELFLKHVMGDRAIKATDRPPLHTMTGILDRVGSEPDDLGYSLLYYLEQMKGLARDWDSSEHSMFPFLRPPPPPPIKLVAIDGIMPSKATIADGSYRLREPVWVVVRRDASVGTVRLRDWLLGAEGRRQWRTADTCLTDAPIEVAEFAILTAIAARGTVVVVVPSRGTRPEKDTVVIDGLKLTMTGRELQERLADRISVYERRAVYYEKMLKEPDSADEIQLPEQVMKHEIDEARDQITVLTLIRDHMIADEIYHLGEWDLDFADLLPKRDDECGCGGPWTLPSRFR